MTTRLLLVDDHEVVRVGLVSLLGKRADLEVIDAVGTGEEAVRVAEATQPDVVVMDVRLPDMSGVEACREIRSILPDTKVLMLTSYADEDAVLASILAGACGYLLKDTTGRDLAAAVLRVASGDSLLDPAVTGVVLERIKADPGGSGARLSQRERTILGLIADGRTNREIAQELFLAVGTVRNLVSGILQKLGAGTRAEAAARFSRSWFARP